jgi:signal transduction histidine kinase
MSIRARFILISLVAVTLSLAAASAVLIHIFADSYGRRLQTELGSHINRLAASLDFSADGRLKPPASPADNRFLTPYGGLYWQIDDPDGGVELRSPSLFDYALPLPQDRHRRGTVHRYRLKGPEDTDVVVQERALSVATPTGKRLIRIAVAIDAAELDNARWTFAMAILPYVAALALFLVLMSLIQLWVGLKPLEQVGADLDAIRDRRADRLPGPYPRELQGLVDQLNRLFGSQKAAMDKARARAGDLAHGLKTPLTVLANNAYTLREKGETEIANELDGLADIMLAHVDHELARARLAPSPDQRRGDADVGTIIGQVIRTLKRTAAGETLAWSTDIPEGLSLPIDPHDFRELAGNLLENAAKWASSMITIEAKGTASGWSIVIEDDGPGVPADQIAEIWRRGVRLDHHKPGSGLGLAIAQEIAGVYGIALSLANRPGGGLRAAMTAPAA